MSVILRDAEEGDAEAMAAIYNREVMGSTATFDTEPVTAEERRIWLRDHRASDRPVIVAQDGDEVVGWASLSSWSGRCAYARAAEVSVYVHHRSRGEGLGRRLIEELIRRAREAKIGVLLARVCTEGEASLMLHRRVGFQTIGVMRRVGEKFGRLLDVELMDLHLDEPEEPLGS